MNAENAFPGLPFMKMHGLGNDFVVIDSRGRGAVTTPALARALGDRNRGVGFDQLAEIRDCDGGRHRARFLEQRRHAGRGLRQRHALRRRLCDAGRGARRRSRLRTARGQLAARSGAADGLVSVNMGQPQLDWAEVPLARAVDTLHLPLPGDPVAVGMGNPHCVFFVADAEAVDVAREGARLEHDPLFPAGDQCGIRLGHRALTACGCGSGNAAQASRSPAARAPAPLPWRRIARA